MGNNKNLLKTGLVMMAMVWGLFMAASDYLCGEQKEREQLENFLSKARVVKVTKGRAGGRTAPWIVSLDDERMKGQAIFKYVHRPRPAMIPDSYCYELAAYELNKLLGLDIMPTVVARKLDGRSGSLQLMLTGVITEAQRQRKGLTPPDEEAFQQALAEVVVFENLVYDQCLDQDDILINMNTWQVWRIDFSESFAPVPELLTDCPIRRCSRELFNSLSQLEAGQLTGKLKPYLSQQEMEALLKRQDLIIAAIKKLIEEQGEEAILFTRKKN